MRFGDILILLEDSNNSSTNKQSFRKHSCYDRCCHWSAFSWTLRGQRKRIFAVEEARQPLPSWGGSRESLPRIFLMVAFLGDNSSFVSPYLAPARCAHFQVTVCRDPAQRYWTPKVGGKNWTPAYAVDILGQMTNKTPSFLFE